MRQPRPGLLAPLHVGVRRRAVAPVRPVLPVPAPRSTMYRSNCKWNMEHVPAVHKLLLGVISEDSSHLLEAGLDQRHVGECHTGAALFLARTHG